MGVLVAGLLVVVGLTAPWSEDATGTPASLDRRDFEVLPVEEQSDYTPDDAAEVDAVDPEAPRIDEGKVVAEIEPDEVPTFELLGVTWTGGLTPENSEVQVRWRQEGVWSDWTLLEPETAEAEGGVPGTAPKWIGPSDAAEARVVATGEVNPEGLTLVTVDSGEGPTLTQAAVSQPGIISRSSWGARASTTCSAPQYGSAYGTIVHHTAGSNSYTAAQSAGIVRSIQAYHMDGQGWCDIGYNFLVDAYGQIFEGRAGGITKIPRGAHAGNFDVNLNTTGVSLMGTFVNDAPSQAMKDALVRLIAWKHSIHGIPAIGTYSVGGVTLNRIDGHYRVQATACPGTQVINWMNAAGGLRDQVQAAMANGGVGLVKSANDPKVYLLANGTKYHVIDGSELAVLASRFGGIQTMSGTQLSAYPSGVQASRYVRDQQTQTLYLLQSDGTKHRFPSAELVASYGYSLNSYLPLNTAQLQSFSTGAEVGRIFAIENSSALNLIEGQTRRPITTLNAWASVRGGSTYAARMSASGASRYQLGAAILEPGVLFKERSSPSVYLGATDSHLVHIPSFDMAADLGATRLVTVADGELARNSKAAQGLQPAVSCGGTSYIIGSGLLNPVSGWDSTGLTPSAMANVPCTSLRIASGIVSPPIFVQRRGVADVYLVGEGELHHVRSWSRLLELAGGSEPKVLVWSNRTAAVLKVGAPEFGVGSYIRFGTEPEVYRTDGRTIQHVTSYQSLLRSNGGREPKIEQVSAEFKDYYSVGEPIT
ncbi:MAG: N-acetylmuramoyl-L-alanine amidase [Aeromicrobium sp.]|uniref:peptidoglycan recognition protein family protein n=1 Tax=Aeromicrobium sp. TaxID=1871063 RepID=UPI0039E4697D